MPNDTLKLRALLRLDYFWQRRQSVRALVGMLVLVDFLFVPAVFAAVVKLLTPMGTLETTKGLVNLLFWMLGSTAALNLVVVLLWLFWRRLPYFSTTRLGVVFAPYSDADAEEVILTLYERFREELQDRSLNRIIAHGLIPRGQVVRSREQADSILERSRARLLIHGRVGRGRKGGKTIQGFERITFTLRHKRLPAAALPLLVREAQSALAASSFLFTEDESFIERRTVVENLREASTFLISLALTLEGRFEVALPLLAHLHSGIDAKTPSENPSRHLRAFRDGVVRCYSAALLQRFNHLYDTQVVDRITLRAADQHARECDEILRLVQSLTGSTESDPSRAIVKFHFGAVKEARDLVKAGKKHLDPGSPAFELSLAFLEMWDRNYKKAYKLYRWALKRDGGDESVLISVVRFLDGVVDNNPERPDIRFGLALVNDGFYDSVRALKEYRRFLQDTEGDSRLNELRRHAKKRVASLGSQAHS